MHPVEAKFCTLAELKQRGADGGPIYDLAEVCDFNEALMLRAENEFRAHKAAEIKASRRGKR